MRLVSAYRLKPTPSAVPTAAKDEQNNNNDEERLGIHDVHSLQCYGYGFGLFTMTTPNRHIIWETPSDKKEVGGLRDQRVAGFLASNLSLQQRREAQRS